jgi:DNA-binding transcriptional ArsR family regulator
MVNPAIKNSVIALQRDSLPSHLPLYRTGEQGVSPREMADKLGVDRKELSRQLEALYKEGLVTRIPRGRTYRYWRVEKWEVECPWCRRQFSVRAGSLKLPSHNHRFQARCPGHQGILVTPMNPSLWYSKN